MNRIRASLFLPIFTICMLLSGCSAVPDPVPNWAFEEKAVTLSFSADDNLNTYDGKSHTLMAVVYQVDDINGFNQLSGYEAGLQTLLKAEAFDISVKSAQRFFIEPGETAKHVLARAQDARHIAIVAGYYQLVPGNVTLTRPIAFKIHESGVFKRKKTAVIQPFTLELLLSPTAILEKKK